MRDDDDMDPTTSGPDTPSSQQPDPPFSDPAPAPQIPTPTATATSDSRSRSRPRLAVAVGSIKAAIGAT